MLLANRNNMGRTCQFIAVKLVILLVLLFVSWKFSMQGFVVKQTGTKNAWVLKKLFSPADHQRGGFGAL